MVKKLPLCLSYSCRIRSVDLTRRIKLNPGVIVVLTLSIIPMFAWKIGFAFTDNEIWRNIALSLAKIGAFGGMTMFALSLILSGRYAWYDTLFRGLDKMYITHRFLGTSSLLLLILHPISLSALRLEQGAIASLSLWFKVSDFGVWLGAMALYGLVGLIIWSIFAKSRYETFIKVHRLLGIVFLLGAAHAFLSGSILAANSFMYWYMLVLTLAGAITFVAYSLLGDILHRPMKYTLKKVTKHPHDIVELELAPTRRIMNFAPGQFVYIAFDAMEDHGYHPFSISSNKRSATLKLVIRETGDFTSQLEDLKVGDVARVKGPYGGFILQLNRKRKQLWIAGGIGVTPFLSGAESLRRSSRVVAGDIEMIYATDDKKPYGLDSLQAVEERNQIFNVTLFDKKTFGYVSFDALKAQIKDLAERDIYICGPPAMLNALRKEAEKGGFADRLSYEEFSY